MKRTLAFVVILLFAMCLSACKKEPSIVGKWTGGVGATGGDGTIEFKEDGTMAVNAKVANIGLNLGGTYKVQEKKLSMTFSKIDVTGVPPQLQPMIDQQKKQMVGKTQTAVMTWKSEDELELKPDQPMPGNGATTAKGGNTPAASTAPAQTLTRVKESS